MLIYNGAMPREAQQIPLEEVPTRRRLTKKWLQVARDLNLYNLLQDGSWTNWTMTDSLLSTIW